MAVAAGTTVLEWAVEPVEDPGTPLSAADADTNLYFEIVGPVLDELQVELIVTI
jgi:hypothetical protein